MLSISPLSYTVAEVFQVEFPPESKESCAENPMGGDGPICPLQLKKKKIILQHGRTAVDPPHFRAADSTQIAAISLQVNLV